MRTCALLLFLLFASLGQLNAQRSRIDSLWQLYRKETNDSLRWATLLRLEVAYTAINRDSAMILCRSAQEIAQRKNDPLMLFYTYNELGNCYLDVSNYDLALENFRKAVEQGNKDKRVDIAFPLSNIALIYKDKGDLKQARRYTEEALERYIASGDDDGVVRQYINLGTYELRDDRLNSARSYFEKAANKAKGNFPDLEAMAVNNIGAVFLKQQNYREAEPYFVYALDLYKELDNLADQAMTLNNLGAIQKAAKNYPGAERYYLAALDAAAKANARQERSEALDYLADTYASMGNYQDAYRFQKAFTLLQDSITSSRYSTELSELEAKYQIIERESKLSTTELELAQQKQVRNLALGGLALLLLVALGGAYFIRQRNHFRQKEAELAIQLEKAEAQKLRELDALKSAFFANISHEFRTPLTLLISPLRELARGQLRGDPSVYYKMMLRQSERLLELINQLLDLTKLDAGAMPLFNAKHDMVDFLQKTASNFQPLAKQRQIQLRVELPSEPVFIEFDKDKFEKIVNNLLSNALKFTPENGKVALSFSKDKDQVSIHVQDTGIGIPEHLQGRVFERFYQVPNDTLPPAADGSLGTGIGLALTKELVEMMGGKIHVSSRETQGSTFSVYLPTHPAPEGASVFSKVEKQPLPTAVVENDLPLILLVEDHADMRAHLREQLSESYRILEASNGLSGLELATEEIPDLIISDVMMPQMDGFELCSRIKSEQATSHIPIVLLTAKTERADKLEGLLTGADDYLPKPFDTEELLIRTANLIRQRKLLQDKYSQSVYKIIASPTEAASSDESFLQTVREEVEKHIPDEGYSVEDLGRSIGLSRSQLYRKLVALTGQGPLDIIRNLRLERAKQLLEQHVANVSEVSYMVGFSSPAYFIKCFRERYGVTPGGLT